MREQRCVINDNPLDGLNEDSDNELYIPPPPLVWENTIQLTLIDPLLTNHIMG